MSHLKLGEMGMVDIDQVDYTERENDSNAYHKGHSEMMREAEGKDKKEKPQPLKTDHSLIRLSEGAGQSETDNAIQTASGKYRQNP